MLEFGGREEVEPTFGIIGAKDTKVRFDFLVGALHLSVSLRVIGSGKFDVILEESS